MSYDDWKADAPVHEGPCLACDQCGRVDAADMFITLHEPDTGYRARTLCEECSELERGPEDADPEESEAPPAG